MAIATAQAVQLLNLAYFGRPGDPASLPAWGAAGITEAKIAEVFVTTSEFTSSTDGVSVSGGARTYATSTYINTLYNRLVARDAAASEVTAWSNAISAGLVTHDNLGLVLVNTILSLDESVEMRQVMMAKLDSANLYSDYLDANPTDLSAYSTQAGIDSGRVFMSTVNTTTAKTYAEVSAVADLLDNPTKYTLTSAAATAVEGEDVTFTLTLDSAPTEAVTVNYVTSNGTTTSADFTSAAGSVVFAAGQTTQFVTVKTTEDTSVESAENFTITFSGTRLNASVQATGTITNDDVAAPTYTLTSAEASAVEGDKVTFTLTLDSAPTEAVTVNYVTGNGSTTSADFTAVSGSVVFAAGQTTQFVTIQTTEDTAIEETETFTITFSGSSLTSSVQAVGNITNDDVAAATYTLTSAESAAIEGNNVTFTLTLDSAPTEAVTVNYVTGNGSTTSADFTAASGSVVFAAGQTTQLVTVQTTDDTDFEEAETFTITFSGSSLNASVQAVGTINNDDVNPNLVVQTFTLTTDSDSFTGKDADDTFTAADGTLTSLDTLVGGSGSDTLTAVLSGDTVNLNTTSVEQINLSNTGVSTVNLESASGVTGVKISDMVASGTTTITLENIQAVVAASLANLRTDGDADTEHNTVVVDFDGDAISGTSDDVLVTLDDVVDTEITFTREGTNTVETISIHTVNEASTLAHFVTTGVGATTLEITGDQALTISGNAASTSLDSEIVTISGADATGAIALTATGGNDAVSITTGSGADAVTSGNGDDTFVTGDGADTIISADGADTITSGAGADSITAGAGNDSIIAGDGADEIIAGAGNNIVVGGAGNDTISATTGEDSLDGGDGDNTFSLAADNVTTADTIKGGADTDTISYSAAGAVADDDFTNVTSVEQLTGAFDIDYTLSTKAAAAGVSKITFAGDAAAVLNDAGETVTAAETDSLALDENFTNDLTVVLDDDSNTAAGSIVATNYTKSLTVQATDIQLDTNVSTLTGGTGADTLEITSTTNNSAGAAATTTVDATDLGQLTNFETIKLLGSDDVGLTLATGNAADGITLTVDATAFTGDATINANNDTDGKIVIKGGTGDDVIKGSSSDLGDSITGGLGDNDISFGAGDLTLLDTVDGGGGSNNDLIIYEALNSTTALEDEDFTNLSNIHHLKGTATYDLKATIGSEAQAAGITAVTFADVTANEDLLTVSSTFTADLTVNIDDDAGGNKILASDYTGNLTVAGTETSFEGHEDLTITGGSGTDTLLITAIAGTDAIEDEDLITVTNVEKITFVEDTGVTGTASIELHNNNATYTSATSYQTITVDTTAITGAAVVSAVQETDAKVVINTGAAADTIIASKSDNLGDSLTAGNGDDTFKFDYDQLKADDTVSGGEGDDTIMLMTAGSVADTAFTNVTSVKTLTTDTSVAMNASLGSNAFAANITTVDFVDDDADDILEVEAGYTGPLTVNFESDDHGNKVDATNYTGALTITADDTMLDEGSTTPAKLSTITGGSGSDTLQIGASAAADSIAIVAGDLAQVTFVDNITFVEASDVTGIAEFAIHNNNAGYTHASDYHSLTIDSSAISGASTIDLSAETDSKVILTTGDADDTVTTTKSVNFGDSISTGLGDDTVIIHNGHLTSIDTITGGGGDDTLKNADALELLDVGFTNVTGFKTIQGKANTQLNLTLGAEAAEAGIEVINLADATNAVDTITLEAGFTNDVTIDLDDDSAVANKIVATTYTNSLTVTAADADITDGTQITTITGGTGSDTLEITMTSTGPIAITDTHLAQVTKVDKFEIQNNVATSLTISDANVVGTSTSSDTLTLDLTALTSAAATVDASAENDGRVVILTGGGGDTITGSTSTNYGDSITSLGGTDTITTGAGADTVDAGAGNDTITGGAGADSLTGGDDSDTFIYTAVSDSNSSAADTLTDFVSGADNLKVTLDYSSIEASVTVDATVQTAGAGVTAAQANLSGARGQIIYDSTNSKQYINFNADNLLTSLDYQINTTTALAEGDVDFTITSTGSYADTITSGSGADLISTGAGNDSITAGAGVDTVTAGAGNDTIVVGGGNDLIRYTASTEGTDVITGFASTGNGTNQIVFTADGANAATTADVFDAGAVVFAATDAGDGAANLGTVTTLVSTDYAEGDTTSDAGTDWFGDNHVNVWTNSTGANTIALALAAIHGGDSTVGAGESAFLVWYDADDQVTTLTYISAVDTGNSFADSTTTDIATFSDIGGGDIADAFAAGNFAVESLG